MKQHNVRSLTHLLAVALREVHDDARADGGKADKRQAGRRTRVIAPSCGTSSLQTTVHHRKQKNKLILKPTTHHMEEVGIPLSDSFPFYPTVCPEFG